MPLPHFTPIASHNKIWEPVYPNLYEVTIVLPPALNSIHGTQATTLLLENTTSIKFPTYPQITSQMQRFKYSTRMFLTFPDKTSVEDLAITFNMNVNENYQVFTWRMMKDWYDLVWNNEDGSLHYKKNIIADIVVYAHDKEGHIIRRVVYHNAQITQFTGWEELKWDSTEIASLTANFVADYWEDFYY
jgi:hypothetical protein